MVGLIMIRNVQSADLIHVPKVFTHQVGDGLPFTTADLGWLGECDWEESHVSCSAITKETWEALTAVFETTARRWESLGIHENYRCLVSMLNPKHELLW